MLFIGPPFGNYISLPGTTSIKGSFTLEERTGLLKQIITTLRYSFFYSGWVNKIGLRNKGIKSIQDYSDDKVYSIAILDQSDIDKFNDIIPKNACIEINVSCPNVKHKLMHKNIKLLNSGKRKWCIVKISPNTTFEEIDSLYQSGFRQFHCCNTLPCDKGGISGPILIPHTKKFISYIKNKNNDVEVIAGGGISDIHILNDYENLGADHFSISTVCFNPIQLYKLYNDYSIKFGIN